MPYQIVTGNEPWAKSVIKTMSIPVVFDDRVGEMEWAVYDDEVRHQGPYRITPTAGSEAKWKLRALGALADWVPAKVIPMVQPARPTLVKTEPKAPEVLTLDTVTSNIMGLQKKTLRNFMELGRWLTEAKKLVGHGNWLEYLQTVKLAEWTAQGCMRMFEEWGSNPGLIEDLNFTDALIILGAPKEARPALIQVARTEPNSVLRKAVRLIKRPPSRVADIIVVEPLSTASAAPPEEPAPIITIPPSPAIEASPAEVTPEPPAPTPETVTETPARAITEAAESFEAPVVAQPTPEPPPPQAQEAAPLQISKQAQRLNRTLIALHDSAAQHQKVIEVFDGNAHGYGVDRGELDRTKDILVGLVDHLKRIAFEYTRSRS